jgi:hypothetical protein
MKGTYESLQTGRLVTLRFDFAGPVFAKRGIRTGP